MRVNNSTVSMTGCTIRGNKSTDGTTTPGNSGGGGGVYIHGNAGQPIAMTNCTIVGNTAAAYGGAIYAVKNSTTPSTVTISGGTIGGAGADANKATGSSGEGGGIYVGTNCTLNMQAPAGSPTQGVQLIGNTAAKSGGGVYAEGATVNITNCTLKGNEAKSGGAVCGVMGSQAARVTISGGTIGGTGADANKATGTGADGKGGGISISDGCTLTLQNNVQVTGNTAHKGTGIYVKNAVVGMKDTLQINTNNDVYLDSGAQIRADGALSPPGGITARITVPDSEYNMSRQVLIAATSSVMLANETHKFTVTPKGSQYWVVKNDGYLSNTTTDIFANISKNQIQAAESSMSAAQITDRQTKLLNKLILYKTSENNYGIMHVTEVNNTSYPLAGGFSGHIKINYKTFNSNGTIKQSDNNKDVVGTHKFNLDNGTDAGGTDFWLENNNSASNTRHFTPENGAKFYVLP